MIPAQPLSRGRDSVIRAVIASLGGAKEETGPVGGSTGQIYLSR